jgi:hypothetical protein
MPPKESYPDRAEKSPPNLLSPEFAAMGKKSIEEVLNVQTELFKNLQETNRHWLEIVQSEAALASKRPPRRAHFIVLTHAIALVMPQ